jgi:hypothetical protein
LPSADDSASVNSMFTPSTDIAATRLPDGVSDDGHGGAGAITSAAEMVA